MYVPISGFSSIFSQLPLSFAQKHISESSLHVGNQTAICVMSLSVSPNQA